MMCDAPARKRISSKKLQHDYKLIFTRDTEAEFEFILGLYDSFNGKNDNKRKKNDIIMLNNNNKITQKNYDICWRQYILKWITHD